MGDGISISLFETRSCGVVQASLQLMILLPQLPECWDNRDVPLYLAIAQLLMQDLFISLSFSLPVSFCISQWYWGLNSRPCTWAMLPALFALGYFQIGSCFCMGWSHISILLPMPFSWLGLQLWTTMPVCWLRYGLNNFLLRLVSNLDPLDFCLSRSWDYYHTWPQSLFYAIS
jgi:hypothetical protein